MANRPSSNVEAFTESAEEKIKVSEIKETILSPELKEKYKDVLLTIEHAEKLKNKNITTKEATTLLTRLHLEQFGGTMEISWPIKTYNENIKAKEIAERAWESLETNVDNAIEAASEIGKKVWDNETVQKIKKEAEELWSKWTMERIEKIPVIGWIFKMLRSFGDFIKWLFGVGKKAEEVKDGVKEALSTEQVKETKKQVNDYITNNFWDTLTEENQTKLQSSLDNLSEEQIKQLAIKLESWEITFKDINQIAPNIFKDFLAQEQIDKIKLDLQGKIKTSIQNEIKQEYWIDLWEWKQKELEELIKNNTTLSDESIWEFIEISNKQEVRMKNLFWPSFEAMINSTSLLIWLISKEILPLSAIWLDFIESWADVVKITAGSIWINKVINLDTFNKNIENLNDEEKALLVWLLYRKWWLFLSIIWNISWTLSRIWIESLTKTQVKTTDLLNASWNNNYTNQINNFEKIAKWLSPDNYKEWTNILREANNNINKLKQNYQILKILSESEWKTSKAIPALQSIWIKDIPNKDLAFSEFVKEFKNKSSIKITDFFSKESAKSALWFWAEADLFKLNKKIETLSSAQRKMFEWGFLNKWIWKLRELMSIWEVSRLWDRMVLHFESIDDAKKWISNWNILANKFPDIVKWTLDKLPIIAVAWISANSEKPFFEELQKQMWYLFPILWPIMIVRDSGFSFKDWEIASINAVEAWIAWALLTLDWIFLSKELLSWGARAWAWYMIKPIKDIYSIWRGTAEWVYSLWKAINNWKSFSWVIKQAVEKTKHIKKPRLRVLAILWTAWYIWINTAFADNPLEEIFWEEGKINKEQLEQEIWNLSDEDKQEVLKYLIAEAFGTKSTEKVNFNINNNSLHIVSENSKIKWDWLIDNDIIKLLKLNPRYTFEYKETA